MILHSCNGSGVVVVVIVEGWKSYPNGFAAHFGVGSDATQKRKRGPSRTNPNETPNDDGGPKLGAKPGVNAQEADWRVAEWDDLADVRGGGRLERLSQFFLDPHSRT
jgi:hypothetical protein